MNLLSYEFYDKNENGWSFQEATLGRINLIVGDSGSGKTRFINTIKNFTDQVISKKLKFSGNWNINFKIKDKKYNWEFNTVKNEDASDISIISEKLYLINDDDDNNKKEIILRNPDKFIYNGKELPKLSKDISSLSLLKDEDDITDIYNGFTSILTRRFYTSELEKNFMFYSVKGKRFNQLKKEKSLNNLVNEEIGFNHKIALLKEIDSKKFDMLLDFYKTVFPFIKELKVLQLTSVKSDYNLSFETPVLCFTEKNVDNWILVNDISSGMQKIFLLALDIFLMQEGGIILIDEFENSLGINAINCFPDLLYDSNYNCQFIISSHHPYIINKIPVENWLIFNRKGMNIRIKSGMEIKDKYSKSKQQQFIQLINDPFYNEGVE